MNYIADEDGLLLYHLKKAFPESSTSTLRSWVRRRRILCNQRWVNRTDLLIKKGSKISLANKPLPKEGPLKIVYEDPDLIVIEKPAGLLSVADDKNSQPSVHAWIKHRYQGRNIPVVHRLDRETSGLMLFALNSESFQRLKEMLKRREVKRQYRAVVEGKIEEDGSWRNYLKEDARLFMQVSQEKTERSELAVTHYQVLKQGSQYSMIDCDLETGKKNQIRAQAAFAHHPIVGDLKYGGSKGLSTRLCLHARRLEFIHPRTHKRMIFESKAPSFFDRLCRGFKVSEKH